MLRKEFANMVVTMMLAAMMANLLFLSCSRTEPRIPFGFIDLIYYQGDTTVQERFTFFIIAEDDDGIVNLDELRLYHDREGLEWIISSADWVHYEEENRHWVGSRSIAMVDDYNLPRGQYRAVLFNKGGEKSERNFTFDAPETPRFPFPVLKIDNNYYLVESEYPKNSFIVYDQQGNSIRIIDVQYTEANIVDLRLPANARFLALWAQDEDYRTSALTKVVSLR